MGERATEPELGAHLSESDDLIPIRMVYALTYCPRQAWYRFVGGEDPLNAPMERGLARHRTAVDAESADSVPPGFRRYRQLTVFAPQLGVTGVLDEVDLSNDLVRITEYKTARLRRFVWPGIRLQVGVQYLALREHAASANWHGPPLPDAVELRVYFTDSRRYRTIPWDTRLADEACAAVDQARAILALETPPTGNVGPHCDNCQHEPVCLPFLTPLWGATQ